MKNLIKNAEIINYDGKMWGDILIEDNKIVKIAPSVDTKADKIIDAKGKEVYPGAIDTHVHFWLPTFAGRTADDFLSGSRAAINGGTTSVIDFVTPRKGRSLVDAYLERKQEAKDAVTNVFFHVSPVEWRESTGLEMETLVKHYGITSFKIYMAYKKSIGINDDILIKVLEKAKELDALVIAHCEHDEIIEHLRDKFIKEGKTPPEYHPLSRPAEAEAEAINRLYTLAKILEVPVYAVHVSTALGIEIIEKARNEGVDFFAETCPQYLSLTDNAYNNDFDTACKYVMSPPLRKENDKETLWEKIENGTIDTVGTDHCSFTLEQKRLGKDDFRKIPNGAGGVEHRLEILYTLGVESGKIRKERFAEITSYNAAKIFKLKDKGYIAEGYDADIVIWNPDSKRVISAKNHVMKADNNIYEGFEVIGSAETVIIGGKIVKENGKLLV